MFLIEIGAVKGYSSEIQKILCTSINLGLSPFEINQKLLFSVKFCNPSTVEIVINSGKGVDVNYKEISLSRSIDGAEATALIHAAYVGDLEIIKLLLKAGAKLNDGSYLSNIPLIEAAFRGHTESVRLFVSRGADINKTIRYPSRKYPSKMSPIQAAANQGHTETVNTLIDLGANKATLL